MNSDPSQQPQPGAGPLVTTCANVFLLGFGVEGLLTLAGELLPQGTMAASGLFSVRGWLANSMMLAGLVVYVSLFVSARLQRRFGLCSQRIAERRLGRTLPLDSRDVQLELPLHPDRR